MQETLLENLIAVDLHVHTPASNCYCLDDGYDIDEAYIKLLRTYRDKEIKVIGITDHNTVNGYNKLIEMKKNSINKINIWSELSDVDEVITKINKEKEKIELFNYFTILPGVEFEAYPGIHLLLIFNPDIDIRIVEEFISDNGYPKEVQGNEMVDVSTVSAIEIVRKAYELGAITIAAHVESDKGGLKNLPSGLAKAQFFKCNELMGIQVVSLSTIDYLKELYKNKEYKRSKLPAFIRCSDYHGDNYEVEKYVTYMKLTSLSFDGIKDAIFNNIECLSFSKNPRNSEIIKELVEQEYTYTFPKISQQYLEEIKKTMCCILNSGQGTIVIGITENNSITGVKKDKDECNTIIRELIENFQESKAFFRYKVDYYEFGNHVVIVLKLKSISNNIYDLNSNVYVEVDKKINIASPNELVRLGEDKFKKSFQFINAINKKRIDKINNELIKIKELEENIGIYKSVINHSLNLSDVFNFQIFDINVPEKERDNIYELYLGESNGDTYFINMITGPHNSECYLRFTCARSNNDIELVENESYSGECIVIAIGGSVHYIEGEKEYKFANVIPIIRLELKEEFKESYSLKCIALWLKSPILLYLMELIYGSFDLFNPKILINTPIIMSNMFKIGSSFEEFSSEMIKYENEILNYFNDNFNYDINSQIEPKIDFEIGEHNKRVGEIAVCIEKQLKEYLYIKEDEYKVIEKFIKDNKWLYFLE